MYTSFSVRNFRGLRDLTIEPLSRVNLFAGPNDVGKTALLEALWMHHAPNQPNTTVRTNYFRGLVQINPDKLLWELFPDLNRELTIELKAHGDWGREPRTLRVYTKDRELVELPLGEISQHEITRQPERSTESRTSREEIVLDYVDESGQKAFSTGWYVANPVGPGVLAEGFSSRSEKIAAHRTGIFLAARHRGDPDEESRRFSAMAEAKQEQMIINILRHVDARITNITQLSPRGVSVFYADVGAPTLLPVPLLGDGIGRLLTLALAIGSAKDGMVLVDEFENGIYYKAMTSVWKAVAQFADELNVQLFATTHSHECVVAAHQAFRELGRDDFRYHRLERIGDQIRAVTFDQEMLETAVQSGLEIR